MCPNFGIFGLNWSWRYPVSRFLSLGSGLGQWLGIMVYFACPDFVGFGFLTEEVKWRWTYYVFKHLLPFFFFLGGGLFFQPH